MSESPQTVPSIILELPDEVVSTATSLTLPRHLTKDQWAAIGAGLAKSDACLRWWIADWWGYGEHRYGDRKKLAATGVFGLTFETLMVYGTVARNVKTLNRFEVLSFTHHIQVATLKPAKQKRYLSQAVANGWSATQLRRQIALDSTKESSPDPPNETETAHDLGDKILKALRAVPKLERPNRKYLGDCDGLQLLKEIVEAAERASTELDDIATWAEGAEDRPMDGH
jgi:hypothetical protein